MTDHVPILIKPGVYLHSYNTVSGSYAFTFTKNIKMVQLFKRNSTIEQKLYTELRKQGIL